MHIILNVIVQKANAACVLSSARGLGRSAQSALKRDAASGRKILQKENKALPQRYVRLHCMAFSTQFSFSSPCCTAIVHATNAFVWQFCAREPPLQCTAPRPCCITLWLAFPTNWEKWAEQGSFFWLPIELTSHRWLTVQYLKPYIIIMNPSKI